MRYERLLEVCGLKEGIQTAHYGLFHLSDNNYSPVKLSDVVQNDKNKTLVLKGLPVALKVAHLGVSAEIVASPDDKPEHVRRKFLDCTNKAIPTATALSFHGKALAEDVSLEAAGALDAAADEDGLLEISGALRIWVNDASAKLNTPLEVSPAITASELMRYYCEAEKRNFTAGSTLSSGDQELPLNAKLSEVRPPVSDESALVYTSASFEVEVEERPGGDESELDAEPPRKKVSAEDHWTVSRLLAEYRELFQGFMAETSAKDELLLRGTPLDPEIPLYRLRLGPKDVLRLRREQQEPTSAYLCAECGEEIRLKQTDPVRCKHCFCRILYKKRTAKICQYNCR